MAEAGAELATLSTLLMEEIEAWRPTVAGRLERNA